MTKTQLKLIFLIVLLRLSTRAQNDGLSLDPNDIPLPTDSKLEVPQNNSKSTDGPSKEISGKKNNGDVFSPDLPESSSSVQPTVENPPNSNGTMKSPEAKVENNAAQPDVKAEGIPHSTEATPIVQDVAPTPDSLKVPGEKKDVSDKEAKFNETYNKYYKEQTKTQNWEMVLGKRTSDTYVVNKGDTLWDISGTLFGDPFYWPKIWALNKELIYNPHVIFPNMKIKFYQGDAQKPPTLAKDDGKSKESDAVQSKSEGGEAENPPGEKGTSIEGSSLAKASRKDDDSETPDFRSESSRLAKLPHFFDVAPLSRKTIVDPVLVEKNSEEQLQAAVNYDFYLFEGELNHVGEVVEAENNYQSVGEGQYVFVKLDSNPSTEYTVLKSGRAISDPTVPQDENTQKVNFHKVEGEIRIIGKVNQDENIYRAVVLSSTNLVSVGSFLVPGRAKKFNKPKTVSTTSGLKSRIIGPGGSNSLIALESFVILNRGSDASYQPGMILPIYEDLFERNKKSKVRENPFRVGRLIIVEVLGQFSIAYIDEIASTVFVSDYVGSPEGGQEVSGSMDQALTSESSSENLEKSNQESKPTENSLESEIQ